MGQRGDKAETASGLPHRYVTRRTAGAVISLFERPATLQSRAHQGQRQVLVEPVLATDIPHRHDLDKHQVEAFRTGPRDEVVELLLVDAAQSNGVNLDRETRGFR